MLIERIREDLYKATKNRDEVRVATLRMLLSALEYSSKLGSKLTEADETAVVKSEVKKRKEAIEIFEKVGDEGRANREKAELEVLSEYMPEQVGEEKVREVVKKVLSEMGGEVNKGMLIGRVMGEIGKENVDGSLVAKVVNEIMKE